MARDSFDIAAALEQYREGLPEPGRTSTQSWGIETWTQGWRDDEGHLDPTALGSAEAAFWYRALTEPTRLGDDHAEAASADVLAGLSGPLTPEEAVRRLRDFVAAADRALTHWPRAALAPAAFPLRCALEDLSTTRRTIDGAVSPNARAYWIEWLGPIDHEFAASWIHETKRARVVEALAGASGAWGEAVDRLTDLGATDRAGRLAERMEPVRRAAWVLDHRRPVDVELLQAVVGAVDDETWGLLCRKVLSRRDRDVWQVLARRPLPTLVSRVLERHDGPLAGWILDWFAMGDEEVLDALIVQAVGRSKRRDAALHVLAELDDEELRERIEALDGETRAKLRERLGPVSEELPELPRGLRSGWMDAFSTRTPRPDDWLAPRYVPPLATRSGHRLPTGVERGVIATLQEARLSTTRQGAPADRFDAALLGIFEDLTPESMTRWWNALFGQWWSSKRPDEGAWVLSAAAFVATPSVVRDLGRSLHHYRKWFGDRALDVLHALRVCGTPWAIAILDDTARRGRSAELRAKSAEFLREAATRGGLTVDAFVEQNLPAGTDPTLARLVAERLEDAMVAGRTWSGWAWRRRLGTPSFGDAAGSVLWAVVDGDGHPLATFRFDGADPVGPDDEPFEVTDDDLVAVAHPATLGDAELRQWNEVFVDYERVQPFEQLARERYRHASLSVDGFRSPIGKSLSGRELRSAAAELGWLQVEQGAHGDVVGFRRIFARWDVVAEIELSTPIPRHASIQTRLARLGFVTPAGDEIDPAFVPAGPFSEVHRDLVRLVD